jgi:hypothetical protein
MIRRYGADVPAWILFGLLASLPWLVVWHSVVRNRLDIGTLLVALALSGFVLAWLLSFRITLTPTEVVFRSLFAGRKSICQTQIEDVRLTLNFGSNTQGPLRLVITPRKDSGAQELNINAKVFSRAAINAVLDVGRRVAKADDGGLRDGIVVKALRERRRGKKKRA